MGVIVPGDFIVVHIKRDFALNVFVLTRFHCTRFGFEFGIKQGAKAEILGVGGSFEANFNISADMTLEESITAGETKYYEFPLKVPAH